MQRASLSQTRSEMSSARTVIEISPGHGAITAILAARCRRRFAHQLDPALAGGLRFRFRAAPQVEVVEADVLEVDFPARAPRRNRRCRRQSAVLRRVANSDAPLCRRGQRPARARHGDDAAGGCGRLSCRARLPRVRAALCHHADQCPRGEAVYAAARGLLAATRGLLNGAAAGVCPALQRARRGRSGLRRVSAPMLRAEAQDAGQQSARRRALRRARLYGG